MAPVAAQSDFPFVRYPQNTEGYSWLWRCSLCQLVKFIDNSSELLWAWIFVTNTCCVSSFQCRWFRVNPIPGLWDIVKSSKLARNRAEQSTLENSHSRELISDSWECMLEIRKNFRILAEQYQILENCLLDEVREITILPLKLKFNIITILPFWINF